MKKLSLKINSIIVVLLAVCCSKKECMESVTVDSGQPNLEYHISDVSISPKKVENMLKSIVIPKIEITDSEVGYCIIFAKNVATGINWEGNELKFTFVADNQKAMVDYSSIKGENISLYDYLSLIGERFNGSILIEVRSK